ncbi:sulfate/thiosulfate ABC transporter permease CysW, partial [Aliarcobacter butzleri]
MKTISNSKSSQNESRLVKYLLIFTALAFLMIMLVVPLITIFAEAFRKGVEAYFLSFEDQYVLSA